MVKYIVTRAENLEFEMNVDDPVVFDNKEDAREYMNNLFKKKYDYGEEIEILPDSITMHDDCIDVQIRVSEIEV